MVPVADLLAAPARALRSLVRQPAFFVTALLILAFGIGANTAIFSIVRTVLHQPLPYAEPGRLYIVWTRNLEREQPKSHFSAPEYLDYRREARSFSHLAALRYYTATWTGRGEAQRVATALVTGNYLEMLGLRPMLGRGFVAEDDQHGNNRVAILTHDFWQSRLGGDPSILGRTLMLDDEAHEVIGILPRLEGEMRTPDLYIPAGFGPQELGTRAARYLSVTGRLAPGSTPQQAEQELQAIAARIAEAHPTAKGWDAWITPAHEEYTREARQPLLVLFAAVGLVLLIACANLASLLMVRAAARRREFAVRAALGAGQGHLIRQTVWESLTLAVLGGAAGLAVAHLGVRLLIRSSAATLPRLEQTSLDGWALAFNFGAALVSGLFFGLIPAWQVLRQNLSSLLRDESRGASGSLRQTTGRSLLVVSEVALSVVLLIGAGLLVRTFDKLSTVKPGFQPQGVLTLRTTLPHARYESPEARANYARRALERVTAIPGVEAAGLTTALPLMGVNWMAAFTVDGATQSARPETATYNTITPGYLAAIGAALKSGRDFLPTDTGNSTPVVLISEELERLHFAGRNPLGRALRMTVANHEIEAQIVGVVRDIKHLRLDDAPRVAIYQPHAQLPWPFLAFAIRTRGEPMRMAAAVRAAFAETDPALPVEKVQPLAEMVDRSLAQQRLAMTLLWIFSIMATALAAVGLYGVIAVAVAQRTREFGIRLALGAGRGAVLRLVLRQGLLLTVAGLAAGLAAAPMASAALEQMLYGVGRLDAATYAVVIALLLLVSLAACLPPAWRACRTDPAVTLRGE